MPQRIQVGQRLPAVSLARAADKGFTRVPLEAYLQGRRVVLVGLPGAFTPICTHHHIPELIEHAPALKASGFDEIICVAPNSPWVVQEWAERTDPEGQLEFLSDGNLELARACGLEAQAPQLYMGACSGRYTMILDHAVLRKLAVETDIEALTCTKPSALVEI